MNRDEMLSANQKACGRPVPLLGKPLVPLTRCAAGKDVECYHEGCPQLRDGEPAKSDRFCPLPGWGDDEE